jgi:RTX calcium-binding nonapeptide repeat (4 copies)
MAGRLTSVFVIAIACATIASAAWAITRKGDGGRDRLSGSKGADLLVGGGGSDLLIGGRGGDVLIGGNGRDVLRGGPGRDSFNIRRGAAVRSPGRDRIDARDGVNDEINCGAGRDVAIVDATEDGVYDCEVVKQK